MPTETEILRAFVETSRHELLEAAAKIHHCVKQLSDDDIWWRPHENMNAIGNLILHVCGNAGQWLVGGIGGETINRDRPAEFGQRDRISRDALLAKLDSVVTAADAALARMDVENLTRVRQLQDRKRTGIGAVFHSVSHLIGHAQEIIYITRMRIGDKYQFRGRNALAH